MRVKRRINTPRDESLPRRHSGPALAEVAAGEELAPDLVLLVIDIAFARGVEERRQPEVPAPPVDDVSATHARTRARNRNLRKGSGVFQYR